MDNIELGPIHPAGTKPVHIGVYELPGWEDENGRAFAHWNGEMWSVASWSGLRGSVQNAINQAEIYSKRGFWFISQEFISWRGLARNPAA